MKYLIDGQRKVLRKGEYVKADTGAGEFIWDDDTVHEMDGLTVDVLKSICRANGLTAGKNATKKDLFANITTNLPNLNVPEQNTMSQSDIIKSVVTEAGNARTADSQPDTFEVEVFTECIRRLNDEGVTFKIKQLGNLVKKEIAEQGLIMTTAQRKEKAVELMSAAEFAPEEWAQVEEMQEVLVKEVTDTDHKQALGFIRKYVKVVLEAEMPKRTKSPKLSFRQKVINFMIENSPVADEALLEFIVEAGKKDEPEKIVQRLSSLRETIDAAYAAGVSSTADPVDAEAA